MGPGKPLALLAYLAASARRTASREHLVDLLWSNSERERGRQSLRQAILAIRRAVGGDAIVSIGDSVTLRTAITSDRDEFLDAVASGEDDRAVLLYHGAYLRELAFPGAQAFEEWADLENTRLERIFLQAGETAARGALAGGRSRDVLRIARTMRDTKPEREAAWRLILQAALAQNDRVALAIEAGACSAQLAASGRPGDAATRRLLEEVRQALNRVRTGDAASALASVAAPDDLAATAISTSLVADLAGREHEFATLLRAWESACRGRGSVVCIHGPAGMGKSRLLSELRARLRSAGGRVVLIRAHPADHEVPFSLASDITKALCALPGALGVSPASVRVLISMAPSVAAHFSSATVAGESLHGITSAHVQALAELVAAVTAEEPLALAIDDLQWADDGSVAVLGSVIARVEESRIMIACASRQVLTFTPEAATLNLEGLGEERVREMLASIADVESLDQLAGFFADLTESTGGAPLLLLETLQFALDADVLRLSDDRWEVVDRAALVDIIREPRGALRRRIAALGADEWQFMLLLAVAGAPVRPSVIARAAGVAEPRSVVRALELRGFVRHRGHRIEIAHDEYADAILFHADSDSQSNAHRQLGRALLSRDLRSNADGDDGERDFQRGIRHAAAGDDEDIVVREASEWLCQARADPRSDKRLVAALLGPHATESRTRAILRARPLGRRVLGTRRRRRATVAFGVLLLACLAIARAYWWANASYQLGIVEQPLSVAPILPAPVVELESRSGARVSRNGDSVRVSLVSRGHGHLEGNVVAPLVEGRAAFGNLRLSLAEGEKTENIPYRLKFELQGAKRALSDSLWSDEVGSIGWSHLQLVSGVVAGQRVDARTRTVTARPGARLAGRAQLAYTTRWGSAAIMLGLTPTWGDRRRVYRELSALPTPMANGLLEVPVDLTAPEIPGDYAIVFAFAAEARVDWIFSGTNWQVGNPVWGDGNDVLDWSRQQWDDADHRGVVENKVLFRAHDFRERYVPATTIRVHVSAGTVPQLASQHGFARD